MMISNMGRSPQDKPFDHIDNNIGVALNFVEKHDVFFFWLLST